VKNLRLRFSASVPTPDTFPELSLLEGDGARAHYVIYHLVGTCESYREFEAGAVRVSFAAVRISSLAAR